MAKRDQQLCSPKTANVACSLGGAAEGQKLVDEHILSHRCAIVSDDQLILVDRDIDRGATGGVNGLLDQLADQCKRGVAVVTRSLFEEFGRNRNVLGGVEHEKIITHPYQFVNVLGQVRIGDATHATN